MEGNDREIWVRGNRLYLDEDDILHINVIGDTSRLPKLAQSELKKSMDLTKNNDSLTIHVALNYGSRNEILHAVKNISEEVKNGNINIEDITEDTITGNLYTADVPDPDLMIRTSGEVRLSNFLLWQLAYTEFIFTEMYWPDFDGDALEAAIDEYHNRHRRFGKL